MSVNYKKRTRCWKVWTRTLKALALVCLVGSCVIPGISVDFDYSVIHPDDQATDGADPLKVGYSRYPYPPLHEYSEDNELVGFDIDLALAAAEIMNVELVFTPINWSERATLLIEGEVDLLWGGLEADSFDGQPILFTSPYLSADIVLLMGTDRDYSRFEDLQDLSVCVLNHTPAFDCLQTYRNNIIKNYRSYTPTQYKDLFTALSSGEYDCMITDVNFAAFFRAATAADYKVSDTILPSSYAVAVRADDSELLDSLQNALDTLLADGTVRLLKEKWIG